MRSYCKIPLTLILMLLLAACGVRGSATKAPATKAPATGEAASAAPLVSAPPPRPTARTVEEFDTTSAEARAAAQKAPASKGETKLGTTVASLGNPAAPGFWLETPLVSKVRQGRVVLAGTGKTVQVELRPVDGPVGGGSRISLAAMRLLGVALTDLPEIEVFAD